MKVPFAARLQHGLPKNLISAAVRRVARSRTPWVKRALIGWFAKHYRIDMREAESERLDDYETFNAFFTRALKPDARRVDADPDGAASPVDGDLTQFGRLERGRLIQAKGLTYELGELLGEPAHALPERLTTGRYATIYLAPHHYHRVHVPVAGRLVRTRYIPGTRFSVNRATAGVIERLFCRNERVVTHFETRFGPACVVLVGALNVSSISTVALGEIASGASREWPHSPGIELAKGAELGRFNLGSTVIVILPAGEFRFTDVLAPGTELRMGQHLGRFEPAT